MIITDNFVYIHKPKTGGSFVTDALLHLYEGKWNLLVHARLAAFKKVCFKNKFGTLILTANKHGGCREIPEGHRSKTILCTIRNPLDYYVSQYEFGWWRRKEWERYYRKQPGFNSRFAGFPNLSFAEFMELMPAMFNPPQHAQMQNADALGWCTVEFINSHFHHPQQALQKINSDYLEAGALEKDMFPTRFIFTHRLNRQLYAFLAEQGFPAESIDFILHKEKVLPQGKGRTSQQKWQRYYTPELEALVRKKDWLLFALFPEFEA